jgi:cation diffusion facilitator CzcD-associated flavoprotein CzcO
VTSTLENQTTAARGPSGAVREVGVAIIGSGFAGLCMAIALKRRGETDFVLLERAQDVGGTWRDNTYPGAACDVQSNLYSFSFALNPDWGRSYSEQPEIQAYLQRVAKDFDVRRHCVFGAEVTGARWDDEARRWVVSTPAGDFRTRILVSAAGALADPTYPDIPGLDTFAGTVMHSARWDADHDLSGEKVAVIGTGASAIQVVPAIQPLVESIAVYQRTPAWVVPRTDHPVAPLMQRLYRRVPGFQKAIRAGLYLFREFLVIGLAKRRRFLKPVGRLAKAHLERQVRDPKLRKALTPDYTIGCKRILISNDYFPAVAAPNDTIVLATGFHVTDLPIAEKIRGRDGRSLAEVWEDGMVSNRSATVAGFPNMFLLVGPNVGVGHTSMVYMIESQVNYVDDALQTMDAEALEVLETTREAQEAYRALIAEKSKGTVWLGGGCASWYLDKHGHNTTLWPDFTFRFRKLTKKLDRENYVGLPASAPASSPEVAA